MDDSKVIRIRFGAESYEDQWRAIDLLQRDPVGGYTIFFEAGEHTIRFDDIMKAFSGE